MMRTATAILLCTLGHLSPVIATAQISPGRLSAAHSSLEGIEHCTACHTLGQGIGNEGCLTCHGEIADRIRKRKGLHGTFANRSCIECHKEHHGRDFSTIRIDTAAFDHSRTGYALAGRHSSLSCRTCHAAGHVRDPAVTDRLLPVRKRTFLGLGTRCTDCHADIHRAQFGQLCTECHDQNRWKPSRGFAHERTAFPLLGAHGAVPCLRCHSPVGLPQAVQVKGASSATCNACHTDVHQGQFKQSCTACHDQVRWKPAPGFTHDRTAFPLTGQHRRVACTGCHGNTSRNRTVQSKGLAARSCVSCHADQHGGRFRKTCEQCHTTDTWQAGPASQFDHRLTRFELKGKHAVIRCSACHQEKTSSPVRRKQITQFQLCTDCHRDVHQGQFRTGAGAVQCERCHTEQCFVPSLFDIADHQQSRFPLEGAHRAVPCTRCHAEQARGAVRTRRYRWESSPECSLCHKDVHGNTFGNAGTPPCRQCHTSESWNEVQYAHDHVGFSLTGKHATLACRQCHTNQGRQTVIAAWKFRGTPKDCSKCHGADASEAARAPTDGGVRETQRE